MASDVEVLAYMLTRTRAAIFLLAVAGSLHDQRDTAGDFWRNIAEEDLRRYFGVNRGQIPIKSRGAP